jgi:hypothetical protein
MHTIVRSRLRQWQTPTLGPIKAAFCWNGPITVAGALLVLAGCAASPANEHVGAAYPAAKPPAQSLFFNLSNTRVPGTHAGALDEATRRVDAVLTDEDFLRRVEAKTDWTYVGTGTTGRMIAHTIRTRSHATKGTPVRPRLEFYKPFPWFWDRCGGFHFWPFYRSISTGCTKDTRDQPVILRNLLKQGNAEDTAEFLVHEWLHAAGYVHGSNDGQDTVEKRNSVPIHVACLAIAFPDAAEMNACAAEPDSGDRS